MRYSFIIPVYNRPEEVDELLNSLTRQTNKNISLLYFDFIHHREVQRNIKKAELATSSAFLYAYINRLCFHTAYI